MELPNTKDLGWPAAIAHSIKWVAIAAMVIGVFWAACR
jgi:hypothetical protein